MSRKSNWSIVAFFSFLAVAVIAHQRGCTGENGRDSQDVSKQKEFCVELSVYKCDPKLARVGPIHIEIDSRSPIKELIVERYYSTDSTSRTMADTLSAADPPVRTMYSDNARPFIQLQRDGWTVLTFVVDGVGFLSIPIDDFPYSQLMVSTIPPPGERSAGKCYLQLYASRCQWSDEAADWDDVSSVSSGE